MRRKIALCVGINDYPGSGSDLSGCVNDARDWQTALQSYGYDVQVLLDFEATRNHIIEALRTSLSRLRRGDRFVFTFSGHGTWIPDKDGDEADQRDEALCCFDYNTGGLVTDDEMHAIFQNRAFGSRVTVFSDSCHSGTVSRLMLQATISPMPKFIPPPLFTDISEKEAARMEAVLPAGKPRSGTVLLSGCADHEYSYDASFGGRPNGAFTYCALMALRQGKTVRDVYDALRSLLPAPAYPQTPQLTAGLWQQRSSLL